jgi:FixJ family two-component response regulator
MQLPDTISNIPQIYLVDHDHDALDVLTSLLAPLNASIKCFISAETFLKEYTNTNNACLLIEADLPGFSGIQLMEYLLKQGQQIPTIVMTDSSDVPMAVRAMQAKAVDYIERPFIEQVLFRKVEEIIKRE